MKKTSKQLQIRQTILKELYSHGPLSRIDIAKNTGITPATVTNVTAELLDEQLLSELGEEIPEEVTIGRKKILLNIAPNHSYFIGLEISEKFLSLCLSDNTGQIVKQKIIHNTVKEVYQSAPNEIIQVALRDFFEETKSFAPKALGIALPGHYNKKEQRLMSSSLFWQSLDLKLIIKTSPIPVFFENNVHCMNFGEYLFSNIVKSSSYIFFHVGRGMFASYMYNGEIYGRDNYLVGEVGLLSVNPDGEFVENGRKGRLQTYSSEAWIIQKSQLLFSSTSDTFLNQLAKNQDEININRILQAYQLGDQGVANILHNAMKYLAITINNFSVLIDSSQIILHGELFSEGPLQSVLLNYIQQNDPLFSASEIPNLSFKSYSPLNGALGACALCVDNLIT